MNQLDVFAGIGGISLAAEWAGIETVAFCEKEPFAQKVLRRRFPGRPVYDDINDLTREVLERDGIIGRERGIDIVSGGFPCQPFSHAGKRTGTSDDRYLWPEMCRIIGELRPTWVFAENVDGLVSMAQSDWDFVMEDETTICEEAEMVVETIRKDLEAIRYQSIPIVIPACGVGASHRRYRIIILGFTSDSGLSQRRRTGITESPSKAATGVEPESERSGETVADPACELSYGSGAEGRRRGKHSDGGAMADPESERCAETRQHCERSEERTACSSKAMGYAKRSGCSGHLRGRSEQEFKDGCQNVVYSSCTGCQECYAAPVTKKSGHYSGGDDPRRGTGAAQSRLGGIPYEFSNWLDGFGMNPLDALINFVSSFPQPALMGQAQHNWEPPRVAIGIKDRVSRLKALGNAVDPLQALPVLYGIRVIHEYIHGGKL